MFKERLTITKEERQILYELAPNWANKYLTGIFFKVLRYITRRPATVKAERVLAVEYNPFLDPETDTLESITYAMAQQFRSEEAYSSARFEWFDSAREAVKKWAEAEEIKLFESVALLVHRVNSRTGKFEVLLVRDDEKRVWRFPEWEGNLLHCYSSEWIHEKALSMAFMLLHTHGQYEHKKPDAQRQLVEWVNSYLPNINIVDKKTATLVHTFAVSPVHWEYNEQFPSNMLNVLQDIHKDGRHYNYGSGWGTYYINEYKWASDPFDFVRKGALLAPQTDFVLSRLLGFKGTSLSSVSRAEQNNGVFILKKFGNLTPAWSNRLWHVFLQHKKHGEGWRYHDNKVEKFYEMLKKRALLTPPNYIDYITF